MKINKLLTVGTLLCITPMAFYVSKYNQLPDEIPVQFKLSGEVSNTAPKAFVVFLMPVFFALINIFIYYKYKNNVSYDSKKVMYINLLIPILFFAMQLVTFFSMVK
jgi:uncharacterized membrane protein